MWGRILSALLGALILALVVSTGLHIPPKPAEAFTAQRVLQTTGKSTACDPQRADTTLILNFNGNITDASPLAATYTNNGSATFSSLITPFAGTQSLGLLSGTQYITGTNAAMNAATNVFSIEGWYYPTAPGQSNATSLILGSGGASPSLTQGVGSYLPAVAIANSAAFLTSSIAMTANAWNYINWTRTGGNSTIAVGGSSGGTAVDTRNYSTSTTVTIARNTGFSNTSFVGYIGPQRVTIGSTRPITVPTAPFPSC